MKTNQELFAVGPASRAGPGTARLAASTLPERKFRAEVSARTPLLTASGWLALAVVLVVALPLYVCMPLWCDVSYYDVMARTLLRGGVHYRDTVDINFPGMHWLHCLVRSVVGWRSEAFRLVDLAVVAAEITLLLRWIRPARHRWAIRGWVALALAAFYLSTREICHCQRDGWMLLPALCGLELRRQQVLRIATGKLGTGLFGWGMLEGLCWGAGVWIKPYLFMPALAVWLTSVCLIASAGPRRPARIAALPSGSQCRRASGKRRRGWFLADGTGLLAGGVLIGAAGVGWLLGTGAWPPFQEVLFGWSGEYRGFVTLELRDTQMIECGLVMAPWSFAHLAAIPISLAALASLCLGLPPVGLPRLHLLLAALSLAWLVQAVCLQLPHEYVLSISILPALCLLGSCRWPPRVPHLGAWAIVAITVLGLWWHPMLEPQRLCRWGECLRSGSTPRIKDALTMNVGHGAASFVELAAVSDYLRGQGVRDRELTCFHVSETTLFLDLHILPATRYSYLDGFLNCFPSKRAQICQELAISRQRFIVSDLHSAGLTLEQAHEQSPADPLGFPPAMSRQARESYPFREPVVLRSGRYLVHRVTGPPAL